MSCNVGQWVEDWYDKDYYNISPRNNPTGPSSGEQRVLRGCAWYDDAVGSRATARNKFAPGNRGNALGFRLARNK
ncbi:MAG: hypothetical protein A2X59_10155 [Nitrospirae bacterium GWC2_42_7]|nr:MAG: hypothetical protein A2X59_10155 [Nitrospirae bacterium GWC2_42_7]